MHFRSVSDLGRTVHTGLPKLPRSIDLVVGIPRSGMLVATLIALLRDLPLTDLDGLLEGRIYTPGTTRGQQSATMLDVGHVLLVDDSCRTGNAMARARAAIDQALPGLGYTTCVAYGVSGGGDSGVHITLENVAEPRVFEWNVLHHPIIERACVSLDGVLWPASGASAHDDEERALRSLMEAAPGHRPRRRIGTLITGRPDKYRRQTEAWLARHDIRYGDLKMLPASSGKWRHESSAAFKARTFAEMDSPLFLEGDAGQATEISRLSGKPVLSLEHMHLFKPGALNLAAMRQMVASRQAPARLARTLLGDRGAALVRKLRAQGA